MVGAPAPERRRMSLIARATSAVIILFLATLAAIVAQRLLTGEINTHGLLHRKGSGDPVEASPERIQLLLSTIAMASWYVQQTLQARGTNRLPDVPASWLAAQGASQFIYLGAKALSFRGRDTTGSDKM